MRIWHRGSAKPRSPRSTTAPKARCLRRPNGCGVDSVRLYRRLQAVFLAGEGHSGTQIAAITGASARSVQYWCAAWRRSHEHRHPQRALAEKPRLGRRPGLSGLDRTKLLAELAQDPLGLGYAATNWTVPLLAAHLQRQGWPVSPRTLPRTPGRARGAARRRESAGSGARARAVRSRPTTHRSARSNRPCWQCVWPGDGGGLFSWRARSSPPCIASHHAIIRIGS